MVRKLGKPPQSSKQSRKHRRAHLKLYITEQTPTFGHSLLQIAERTEKNSVWDITLSIKITEVQHDSVVAKATQIRDETSVDSSVPQTNSNVNTDAENSSNSSTDIRYSKELMTAEEKKKVREAERGGISRKAACLNRTARRKSKSRFSDSKSRSSKENSVRYARRIDSSGKRTAHKV